MEYAQLTIAKTLTSHKLTGKLTECKEGTKSCQGMYTCTTHMDGE